MRNETLQQVLELEEQLKKLSGTSGVIANITTESMGQLEDAAAQLSVHVFQPFESNKDMNVHYFKYYIKGHDICIVVKHKDQYRIKKELVPL